MLTLTLTRKTYWHILTSAIARYHSKTGARVVTELMLMAGTGCLFSRG